ncbi:class I SAM-dependent methyltransferase [Desulfurobacterium sp.]
MENEYSWNAGDYAKNSLFQKKWARELIKKLSLKGNERILDIGCGDGKVTFEIAQHVPDGCAVGIDSSEEMVKLASKMFPPSKYPNLSFKLLDVREMDFFEEFDVIFSNAALHWVIDHKPVLRRMFRALKPGGRAVVQMGGKGNAAGVVEVLNKIMTENPWKEYFLDFSFPYGFHSPERYKPRLIDAGFKVQYIELKPKMMIYESVEKFKGWIRTTWLPYINRVPEKLRNSFIDLVVERYLDKHPIDGNGRIKVSMQRLEFVAVR